MPESAHFENPSALLDHLWQRLVDSVADRHSALHVGSFCTVGADGQPEARSIILRQVNASQRIIRFHTDRRSPKVAELKREPRATILLWEPASRTQLRLGGLATVATSNDDEARQLMSNAHPGSLGVYRSVTAPSTPVESPDDCVRAEEPILTNIAVVGFVVHRLEWLWLNDAGHQRCRFTFGPQGNVSHQWLAP